MRYAAMAIAVLLAAAAAPVHAQALSEAEIQAAIKAGQEREFNQLLSTCVAKRGSGEIGFTSMPGGLERDRGLDVTVSQNAGRIARLSAGAKRLYEPLSPVDIPKDLTREPTVFVSVAPQHPLGSSVSPPVERVVLQSKWNENAIIRPKTFETEPVKWPNLLGPAIEGNRALATFSLEEVRHLPPGDFYVVVITPHGERRCTVDAKDRMRLFP